MFKNLLCFFFVNEYIGIVEINFFIVLYIILVIVLIKLFNCEFNLNNLFVVNF